LSARSRFAAAVREELWIAGALAERRLSCGEAIGADGTIEAQDVRDAASIARCDELLDAMRSRVDPRFRTRLVAEVVNGAGSATIVVSDGERAVVSSPESLDADLSLLSRAATAGPREQAGGSTLPLVWRNGSGAVLLHEAVGHPHEHGLPMPQLPPWLSVDVQLAERRASFRDVPLVRMTAVAVTQRDAPFNLPQDRVEVHLVDGGAWDPLTDTVTARVSFAEIVSGDRRAALEPFTIAASRHEVLASLRGAQGAPERYPGVICSREGQELFVASHAPAMLTVFA
jgi:hypothetical protein